jgi:hypothetical protein
MKPSSTSSDALKSSATRHPPRRGEANIQIINHDEAKELLPLEKVGLSEMDHHSAVSRSTDLRSDATAPICVFTRSDLTEAWLAGVGRGGPGQILFGEVLVELIFHLLAGEVELDLLSPKIVGVVRQTIV